MKEKVIKQEKSNNFVDQDTSVENFDVANTLYILSESLGKDYEENKISPFSEDFEISDKFIKKVIENKEPGYKIVAPLFLENSNKEIQKLFQNSLEENIDIVDTLSKQLLQGDFDKDENLKEEVKDVLNTLKARQKLIEIDIKKLKNKNEDSLKMYVELVNLGKRIEEIMEITYTKKLQKEVILLNLIEYAKGLANINRMKNIQLKQQENIIKNKLEKTAEKIGEKIEEKNINNNKINTKNIIKNNKNEQNIEENMNL